MKNVKLKRKEKNRENYKKFPRSRGGHVFYFCTMHFCTIFRLRDLKWRDLEVFRGIWMGGEGRNLKG